MQLEEAAAELRMGLVLENILLATRLQDYGIIGMLPAFCV